MGGYDDLLRVVEDEAARESERVLEAAHAEAVRIVAEAREVAAIAREGLVRREQAAAEARLRAAREGFSLARDRRILSERRSALDAVLGETLSSLTSAGGPEVDARILAELAPELPEGPFTVEVDPGAEEAARETLSRLAPAAAERARIVTAPARRGGIRVEAGRLELDATLASRLERAWPALEPELASALPAGGG